MRHCGQQAGVLLALSAIAWTGAASASELIVYRYDSLGRLIQVEHSGTVNSGVNATYSYDASDNRTNVTVGVPATPQSSSPALSPSLSTSPSSSPSLALSPSLSPLVGNQPPVAIDDRAAMRICDPLGSFLPLANDHDPDGTNPLILRSVTYSGALGTAIAADPQILFMPNGIAAGTALVTYTVQDAQGASATGTLTLTVAQGPCS
jgi:hypothetical protein